MRKSTRILIGAAAGMLPMLLYSYSSGPDPRMTGAPGDETCARSACHTGTPLNGGGGSATLVSSGGSTYSPGQQYTLTLTIRDSAARGYGFQATARLDSNPTNGQAGGFTAGANQIVICSNGATMGAAGCPASGPLQFIEHTRPLTTNTITVTWKAPATDVGPVTIYAAANAANLNTNETGDHIYTTSLKLSPAASTPTPQISSGGVAPATAFRAATATAPGGWLEIFGSNLAPGARSWASGDFQGSQAPTSLDGVSVTVGGKAAYVSFISAGQVNVQVPDGVPIGSGVPVVVKNGSAQSNAATITIADVAPEILAPSSFAVGNRQYVVAVFPSSNGSVVYAGPAGAVAGVSMRPAKPGEIVTLYGVGFGAVSPAAAAGSIASQLASVTNSLTAQFGSTPATIQYAGIAPGFVGLYQINLTVPNVLPGDYALNLNVNGTPVAPNIFITVGQ